MIAVVVALFVIIAVYLGPSLHRGRMLLRLLPLLILVVLTAMLVLKWRLDKDPTGGMLRSRMMALSNISSDVNMVGRTGLRTEAWEMAKRFPFGSGFADSSLWGKMTNPHFLFLWILQGSGWIGAIGFIWAISGMGVVCLRSLKRDDPRRYTLRAASLGILVLVLVEGLGSIVFATEQIIAVFWAVMGASLAVSGRGPEGIHIQAGDR
jgi:hypothetical protein